MPIIHKYDEFMKSRGLGDAVESLAKPIAKVLDGALGTTIQSCGGCAKRKEYLNSLMPKFPTLTRRKG